MDRKSALCSLACLVLFFLAGCGTMKMAVPQAAVQVSVSSANTQIRAGAQEQFTAQVTGAKNPAVRWMVNSIEGGTATIGTIDVNGVYTAPETLPNPNRVTISVASLEKGEVNSAVTRTLLNPIPQLNEVIQTPGTTELFLQADGANFVLGAQIIVNGVSLNTEFVGRNTLRASIPLPSAPISAYQVSVANPAPGATNTTTYTFTFTRPVRPTIGSGFNSANAAARFLDQATFGPTAADIASVQTLGMPQWIDNQINNVAPSTWTIWSGTILSTNTQCNGNGMFCLQQQWFQNALSGPDQLRQRTAFALSEIWAVGGGTVALSQSYTPYYRTLNTDAFSSYRTLMGDITISSGMGYWLDMGNNDGAGSGANANENYAREILQLFTVGLYLLNDDGTYKLDNSGNPIPTYDEPTVQNFARVFTGWTYKATGTQNFPMSWGTASVDMTQNMVAVESHHNAQSKALLTYNSNTTTLPPNQNSITDLNAALDNIFNHPNVPPYVCTQIIRHLVSSNPTPAYVSRCSQVFKNDFSGRAQTRGNMDSVVKAILLDPEARAGDAYLQLNNGGHLREPVLMITGILRGLNYSVINSPVPANNWGLFLASYGANMEQNVLFTPTVFNYFSADYVIPNTNLAAPEFDIHDTASTVLRVNYINQFLTSNGVNGIGSGNNIAIDITPYSNLANANVSGMLDLISSTFFHGQMSTATRSAISTAVSAMAGSTSANATSRAQHALYLALSSSQYQVIQ